MKKDMLKIIPRWGNGRGPAIKTEYADIKPEERDNNSWWYFHGKLEEYIGFDKGVVSNCKSSGNSKETIDFYEIVGDKVISANSTVPYYNMYVTGEIDVEVEGINKPCKGFFYVTDLGNVYYQDKKYEIWKQRGLVCFSDDEDACTYARNMMIKLSRWL